MPAQCVRRAVAAGLAAAISAAMLTACGGDPPDPGPAVQSPAVQSPAAQSPATPAAGRTQPADRAGSWCGAWHAVDQASIAWAKITPSESGSSLAEVEAGAGALRARLAELLAAAPAQLRSDVKLIHDHLSRQVGELLKLRRGEPATVAPPAADEAFDEVFARVGKQVAAQCR